MMRRLAQLRPSTQALAVMLALMAAMFVLAACGKREEKKREPTETTPVVVPAAPKPTGPLPANTSCVTPACHAVFTSSPQIHGPVAMKSCTSCHAGDAGGHTYPLLRKGNELCTFCHAVSGTSKHQHKALADVGGKPGADGKQPPGGCLSCHSPHVSKTKYLLTADTVGGVCAKCHDLPLKKHAHEPFAAGQCTVCHQPHQSEFAGLLRNGEGPTHCLSCHTEKKKAFASQSHVHKPTLTNCNACHGPHATDFPKQLKSAVNDACLGCHTALAAKLATSPIVHGAVDQGCNTCHDAHASSSAAILKDRMDRTCMTCHDKPIKSRSGRMLASMKAELSAKYLHGPVKSGSCSECHDPHAGAGRDLLRKDFPQTFYAPFKVENYALCFSCHDKNLVLAKNTGGLTNFRDGEKNLHFVHVNRDEKGRTCRSCHEVHGSDLPNHMAEKVPFEGSKWAMPMNYEPSEGGGTCTPGCHKQQSYTRTKTAATKPAEGGTP